MVKKAPEVERRYAGKLGGIERGIDMRKLSEELGFYVFCMPSTAALYCIILVFCNSVVLKGPPSFSMFLTGYHIAGFVVMVVMQLGWIYGIFRTVRKMNRLCEV